MNKIKSMKRYRRLSQWLAQLKTNESHPKETTDHDPVKYLLLKNKLSQM